MHSIDPADRPSARGEEDEPGAELALRVPAALKVAAAAATEAFVRELAAVGTYLSPRLVELDRLAREHEQNLVEPSSQRRYDSFFKGYRTFCELEGLKPWKPDTLRLYLAGRVAAGDPKSTLRSRLAAIRRTALKDGAEDPTRDRVVQDTRRGIMRSLPSNPRRVAPATFETLESLVAATKSIAKARIRARRTMTADATSGQLRDRALVLLGFALGRRGAELVRVDVDHLERQPSGLLVKIPRTKTNWSGEPEYVGMPSFPGHPLCPVRALEVWLTHAKIASGPVFVTLAPRRTSTEKRMRAQDVSRRHEAIAEKAGLEGVWRSHSLRRGVVKAAEVAGVARSRTRTLTGWKGDAMSAVYADHREKIAASPLIDIYATRERQLQIP